MSQQPALFDPEAGRPIDATTLHDALRKAIVELMPDIVNEALYLNFEGLFQSLSTELPDHNDLRCLINLLRPQAIRHNPPRRRPIQPTLRPCRKR